MTGQIASLIAVLTAVAAIITCIGGILLAIRTVRNRERTGLTKERKQLEEMLDVERQANVKSELRNYRMEMLLAEHGIAVPEELKAPDPEKTPDPEKEKTEPGKEKSDQSD